MADVLVAVMRRGQLGGTLILPLNSCSPSFFFGSFCLVGEATPTRYGVIGTRAAHLHGADHNNSTKGGRKIKAPAQG